MEHVPVESSSLRSVAYDATAEVLEIAFHSGRVYRFAGVPASLHAWLMRSPGKGGLFNRLIRDRYPFTDVTVGESRDLEADLQRSLERLEVDND